MKRMLAILLILLLVPCAGWAEFSESSSVYDPALADWALQIAGLCYMPSIQEAVLNLDGYRKVGEYNFDRAEDDPRHVAAYTLYDRPLEDGGTGVVIAVRGTGKGEWKLNMELMPSGDYQLDYAENFFLAAQDVLDTHADYLDGLNEPVFLVTGHSRGAAVANILGAQLSDRFGAENVFAYTFATPRTVRGDYPAYDNIFNVINPSDLVTYLPFPQWGFARYGVDLTLPVDDASPELLAEVEAAYAARSDRSGTFRTLPSALAQSLVENMTALLPELNDDFTLRHALAHPGAAGEDEDGMTAGEFFLLLFDGNLLAQGPSSQAMQRLTQAENDFTPLLTGLQALSDQDSASALSFVHLPASYGAWMTAALK